MIRSRPYARHLLAMTLIVVGIVLAVAALGLVLTARSIAVEDEERRLQAAAALLAQDSRRELVAGKVPVLPAGSSLPEGVRLTILSSGGTALADSEVAPAHIPGRLQEREVQQALAAGTGSAVSYRMETGQRERTVCVAIRKGQTLLGFAVASSPVLLPWRFLQPGMLSLLLVLLVAALLATAAALLLTRHAARPIAQLADALERRSTGSLAGLAMHADISELGRAQKASYALLQEGEQLVEREHMQSTMLSAILESVPQSIVVISETGAILSCNRRFEETFAGGKEPAGGHHLAELVEIPGCLAAIDHCLAEHKPQSVVAEDRDRYYACSVQELADSQRHERRLLVVLEDITEAMNLPRIKADFVANASHELRTPLTAIRGYLELLREEPGNARYMAIVERNVERLIALSSDISLLSRMENRAPEIELVDMQELQTDLTDLFAREAQTSGIPLLFQIASDGRFLYGDRLMLLQMFINLIENSYRFTKMGSVTVGASSDELHILLRVTDTGEGIPASDVPRIFERFYSRSGDRSRPGTGLGLAIVKRIVLAHNGIITVDSEVGKGTTFTIRIPKNLGPRVPSSATPVSGKEDA